MTKCFDVIVAGAGIVGLSAATGMRQRGFSVAVVDAGSLVVDACSADVRVYAINQASQAMLEALGAWFQLDKTRISPYRHMHVWDAVNGACIDFDARMVGRDKLGAIIEESVIKQALLKQAEMLGVVFFPQNSVSAVRETADGIEVQCGALVRHAKLLIAADGARSVTRELLGVEVTTWPYHQHALVATVRTEKEHQYTAWQVFNADGPLAFLPMTDPHQCSIVWSTTAAHAQSLRDLPDDEFNQELTQAFAGTLGECHLQSARYQFPLHMRHAQQYTGKHWILMGDAAHSIHPLAGLGLNVGLADVSAWLAILDGGRSATWSAKRLGDYQRQRKHAVWQTIMLMEGLKMLFTNPLPPVVAMRGIGLSICNSMPILKRIFIEQAAG